MQSSRTYKIYSEVLWAKRNNYCPVDMNILLTGELAEFQYARRIAYTDQKILDKEVEEWLDLKIIKYFRVCFMCCDYRKLNEKIVRDHQFSYGTNGQCDREITRSDDFHITGFNQRVFPLSGRT